MNVHRQTVFDKISLRLENSYRKKSCFWNINQIVLMHLAKKIQLEKMEKLETSFDETWFASSAA